MNYMIIYTATWGIWGTWNDCSVTCGYGVRIRNRSCNDPDSTRALCEGGLGAAKQAQDHNFGRCGKLIHFYDLITWESPVLYFVI